MKSIQFELWTECNVGCRFCYLHKKVRKTPKEDKMREMAKAEAFLTSGDLQGYDIVAFIGGEFMQGQLQDLQVRSKFFYLLRLARELVKEGKLSGIWLSASLTHESLDTYEILDMFKDVKAPDNWGGFWLITSYDTIYRFTPETHKMWAQWMTTIKDWYPNIRCNTTMILTQDLIEKYLAGEIRFQTFIDTYNTQLFFKPPHLVHELYANKQEMEKRLPGFFLKRKDFLNFLARVYDTEECWTFDKICNINFRADALYRSGTEDPEFREKDTVYEIARGLFLPCGHSDSYGGYIDSDACMLCDKHRLAG